MSKLFQSYAFEDFPRAPLSFHVSRRGLLSALMGNLHAWTRQASNIPAYSLSELGTLPDSQLGLLVPEVLPAVKIDLRDDGVWAQPDGSLITIPLFKTEQTAALTVFNLFNGRYTLMEVSSKLAQTTHWKLDRCFAYVRGLFLWLVLRRVCAPKNGWQTV